MLQLLHALLLCSAAIAATVRHVVKPCCIHHRRALPARSLHTALLPCTAEMLAQHADAWPTLLLSCLVVANCNIRNTSSSRRSTDTAGEKLGQ
jgi:hypothetical protein